MNHILDEARKGIDDLPYVNDVKIMTSNPASSERKGVKRKLNGIRGKYLIEILRQLMIFKTGYH